MYRKSTNFFQIFPVHGTITKQHVQQTKLDYLARKCNIPVNIPSRDTSFFPSFLPSFPYSFLLFTLCVLPLHNCFFIFSFSVITSFFCVCFKYFLIRSYLFLEVLIPNSVCISCFYHAAPSWIQITTRSSSFLQSILIHFLQQVGTAH